MRPVLTATLLASVAAALLLLFWTSRAPAPKPVRNEAVPALPAAVSPQAVSPLPSVTRPLPSVISPPPSAPTFSPPASRADDRLELARRCLQLADTDPLAAMELALEQKLTAVDPGLLSALILRWAEQDFSGALEWARTQPRDTARDDILARLAYLRAQTDPLAAARIVVNEMPPGHARDEAIVSIVHQWARQDRETAKAWADSFAEGPLKSRVLAEVQESPGRDVSSLAP